MAATYVHHVMFPRVETTGADDGAVEAAVDAGARYAQEHSSVETAPLGICSQSKNSKKINGEEERERERDVA